VEAGLRTGDRHTPFPEEINRRITYLVADLFFAPTKGASRNLLAEGIDPARIHVTGNTAIDALLHAIELGSQRAAELIDRLPRNSRLLLVTAHRRENFGQPLEAICRALREIAEKHETIRIVFPVHLNPAVRDRVHGSLDHLPRVTLLPPLEYFAFAQLLARCHLVLTDSGGIQEEAPSLGKPVLVLRDTTERPEAVESGNARLVGTDSHRIVEEVDRLLVDARAYRAMAKPTRVFGDGRASERICDVLSNNGDARE
jgi:UDP-N-acetylglucosamine 2-epimerase (non-hydrolysing)